MSSGPASSDAPGKAQGKGRHSPICFRCGKKGHLSKNCTNHPIPKKRRTEVAELIFDMAPWANGFAEWRAQQLASETPESPEDVNTLEETKGCAIMDSGATVM